MAVICERSQIASAGNIWLRREIYPIRISGHAGRLPAKTFKTVEIHHHSLVDGIDVHIGGCDVGRGQLGQDVVLPLSGPLDADRCFLISSTAS